ncbi:MAG: sigma-70 family RNA polymerase sigma factor [Thermincola sp.]|nr:sigma-70 family RNA polymerase sigma factor [Thermincola sp.]
MPGRTAYGPGSPEERERNIIALKFKAGLTNRHIAELIGLSESNVGVILYRAIRQLRSILKSGVSAGE